MTITFDYFSIAISVFLLLLALISPWFSSMARRPRIKMADDMVVHDEHWYLALCLVEHL